MSLQFLVPPIIGGIIGYVTNDIAIKMLFHPRKPVYIGKWQLPFTPGLIPKEKDRVARSIGQVVSTQLLDSDTLIDVLTSDEMVEKLRSGLEKIIDDNRRNQDTLHTTLTQVAPQKMVDQSVDNIKTQLVYLICSKLNSIKFGERVSSRILQKINNSVSGLAKGFGFGFNLFDDKMLETLSENIGEVLDKALFEHSGEIVKDLVDSETEKLLQMCICDIISKYDEKIPDLLTRIVAAYTYMVRNNIETLLKGLDIGRIVEEKISSFSVIQLESMIFGIMKKELKAIVYLGALLGFLMGWITPLIGG